MDGKLKSIIIYPQLITVPGQSNFNKPSISLSDITFCQAHSLLSPEMQESQQLTSTELHDTQDNSTIWYNQKR